ncbi:MAG: hypothetical protein M1839_008834 [Geoglossum umbratile]|nr:MAG: hypothetical protein M1839_008834 [Geoglossum umbratile]
MVMMHEFLDSRNCSLFSLQAAKYEIMSTIPDTILQTIEVLNKTYEAKDPKRILTVLGYNSNILWNPVDLYLAQHRLKEAEVAFRSEAQGRTESMGILSSSRLSLLGTLALIRGVRKYSAAAESVCRESVERSIQVSKKRVTKHFGAGLIEKELSLPGPEDGSTLASRNRLGAALYFQGRYDERLQEVQHLASLRRKLFGPSHSEMLDVEEWISQCLVEEGQFSEAERVKRTLRKVGLATILVECRELGEAGELVANEEVNDLDSPYIIVWTQLHMLRGNYSEARSELGDLASAEIEEDSEESVQAPTAIGLETQALEGCIRLFGTQ